MTVIQTILVFVGIPAAIVLALFLMVFGPTLMRQPNRYRPGRPWNFEPAWYKPHPDAVATAAPSGSTTAVGGATGEW